MSQTPPPIVLQYRSPQARRPWQWKQFGLGLLVGITISSVYWFGGFAAIDLDTVLTVGAIGIPLIKLVWFIVCMFYPDRRAFGIGMLVSLPLGVMIFFGACVSVADMNFH